MIQKLIFIISLSTAVTSFASQVIFAEGRAMSPVAEHVVLEQARLRLRASARQQCQQLGYFTEPLAVSGAGRCTAWYQNHHWQAHCYSEFYCD